MKCLCWQTLNEEQGVTPHRHLPPRPKLCYSLLLVSPWAWSRNARLRRASLEGHTSPDRKVKHASGGFISRDVIYCLSFRASKSCKVAPLFATVLFCCHVVVLPEFCSRTWPDLTRPVLVSNGIREVAVQKQRQAELNARADARAAFRLCQLAASLSRSEMTPHFHKGIRNSLDFLSQLIIVWV